MVTARARYPISSVWASVPRMYKIIAEVCPLIWDLLSPIYLRWSTPEEWKVVAEWFRVR